MKSNIFKLLLILLFLNISNLICAQQSQTITVRGKVVDYMSKPVEGAEIAVYQELNNYDIGRNYAKEVYYSEKTDTDGNFSVKIEILSVRGNICLIARKEGLAMGWDIFGPKGSAANKLIILEKPCILEGTVFDEEGQPVVDANVQAVPKSNYLSRLEQNPIIEPKQWFSTKTDSRGMFHFNNFNFDVSAEFWIDASGWSLNYQFTPYYLDSFGFETGRTDIKLVLPKEVAVHGKVIDAESGDAIGGAKLYLRPKDISDNHNLYYPKQTVSGTDGRFSFQGVPPGTHYVQAFFDFDSQFVDKLVKFVVNPNVSVKEVLIKASKGGLVEITVLDASTKKPISGINGSFFESKWDEKSSFSTNVISDKEGLIRVWAPPVECKYVLDCSAYTSSRIGSEFITIMKNHVEKREYFLERDPKISGIVVNENGQPVSDVLVIANPVSGTGYTDKNGRFEVQLDPEKPCERLIARDIKQNLMAVKEVSDFSKPIRITLQPAFSITGQVTDPNGLGISAVRLILILNGPIYFTSLQEEIVTDSQGRYVINALPPMPHGYEYSISACALGYGTKGQRFSIDDNSGTSMTMKTIVLNPANKSLSGIVVYSNNIPAPGIPIILQSHGNGQRTRHTVTDKDGKFNFNKICDGPLGIQAGIGSKDDDVSFLVVEKITGDVKIALGETYNKTKEVSLIGKQLPDPGKFNINIDFEQAKSKEILFCFFDIEQRPSRSCILELGKKAEELEEKNIEVILVHTSTIEKEYIENWVRENSISFPIGMIETDGDQTKFNWGVKALPWMILTDKEHVVIAAGFSIDELGEEIGGK